jgi:hypothetical protein
MNTTTPASELSIVPQATADAARPHARDDGSGVCVTIAQLPDAATIDLNALAKLLDRHPVNVQKAVRRGELPPAIRFMGRKVWLAGAIRRHLEARQAAVIKTAERRDAARPGAK